jgi:signal transduction histidine kinase
MKTLHEELGINPIQRKARQVARALTTEEREALRGALHDGLGQLLTSISFLAGSLQQKLAAQKLPEETEAAEILSLTSRAISETQALVHEPEHSAFP